MATIMLVDDSATSRAFMKAILSEQDHRVIEAADGATALGMLGAVKPDLVISDILMPRMDGFEFVRRLRQRHSSATTPVIFLSGHYDQLEARELARSCGVKEIIAKDSEPDLLLETVGAALQENRRSFPDAVGGWFDEDHLRIVNDKLVATADRLDGYGRRLASLVEINLRLAAEHDPNRLLAAFCQLARSLAGAQHAVVGTLHPDDSDRFCDIWTNGYPISLTREIETLMSGASALTTLAGASTPVRLTDAREMRALGLPPGHPSVNALLAVPIRSQDRDLGVILVSGKIGEDAFTVEDEKLLTMLASQVGRMHEVAALCEQLAGKEHQLALFYKLVEQSGQAIGISAPDGRRIYMNPAERRMLGIPEDADIGGRLGFEFYAESERMRLEWEIVPTIRTAGSWSGEVRMRTADGREFPTFHHGFLVRDPAGELAGIAHIWRDLTARRQTEARLNLLSNLFEQSGEGLAVTDAAHNFVSVNPAFTRLTGYTLEELQGRTPDLLVADPMESPTRRDDVETALQTSGHWHGETRGRRKDGVFFAQWMSLSVVRGGDGEITHRVFAIADVTERKAAEAEIRRLASQDMLTGLPNRINLQGRLEQAIAAARRDGTKVAVLCLDLDRFKTINESLGHAAGDELLREVGRRLAAQVRDSDIVARPGGDEFVVVLTAVASTELVVRRAETILAAVEMPFPHAGHDLSTTASLGIALFPDDGTTAEELLKNADTVMYHAKAQGRNNFQFFAASMNKTVADRLVLEHSMRRGLEREEFTLHYQPQIGLRHGLAVGFEALVRWRHPEQGMISPARFIPVAEDTGMIRELGGWVLREALRELRRWRDDGIDEVRMAVNVSARQLRSADFPTQVAAALAETGLKPGDIELEVTESAAMQNPEQTIRILHELREMGIELSIDDFGTGYSSLNYLKLLPVQRLKLDQSFVRGIETDPNDRAICTATIALAHSLGLEVIAEGVETEPQLLRLSHLGSDFVQGYLFSRPVPVEQARALIGLLAPANALHAQTRRAAE